MVLEIIIIAIAIWVVCILCISLGSNDFNPSTQTATIIAGKDSATVNITIMDDTIIEGNENFNMSLSVPSLFGPGIKLGDKSKAIGVIIDTTSE